MSQLPRRCSFRRKDSSETERKWQLRDGTVKVQPRECQLKWKERKKSEKRTFVEETLQHTRTTLLLLLYCSFLTCLACTRQNREHLKDVCFNDIKKTWDTYSSKCYYMAIYSLHRLMHNLCAMLQLYYVVFWQNSRVYCKMYVVYSDSQCE